MPGMGLYLMLCGMFIRLTMDSGQSCMYSRKENGIMKPVRGINRIIRFWRSMKHLMDTRRADVFRVTLICISVISLMILIRIAGGSGCLIKSVFGIPCPACGMTRAWLSFCRGDFAGAFMFHPLFLLPAIIVVLFIFIPRVRRYRQSTVLWAPVILLSISVYAVRMYYYFPNVPPLDFNYHALFVRLGRMILSVMI